MNASNTNKSFAPREAQAQTYEHPEISSLRRQLESANRIILLRDDHIDTANEELKQTKEKLIEMRDVLKECEKALTLYDCMHPHASAHMVLQKISKFKEVSRE